MYELKLPIAHHDQVTKYKLRISSPSSVGRSSHYNEDIDRSIEIDPEMLNEFLFDVHFKHWMPMRTAPGTIFFKFLIRFLLKKLSIVSGSDVSFWNHLYIYSYFIITIESYDIFDSFLQQFNVAIQKRERSIARENLNSFFYDCRKFYSVIEQNVKEDIRALKILVRMVSSLPIHRDNMTIGNEATRQFASIVLKNLSEKLTTMWPTNTDAEWPSFREGLVTLCCIKLLHYQRPDKPEEDAVHMISTVPNDEQKQEIATHLLNLLTHLQCTFAENQEVALYALVGEQHLKLEHLELANSLETYINTLGQLMMAYHGDINELGEKIQAQLNTLITQKRFVIRFPDIQFILNYMKRPSNDNEIATKQIQFILETNNTLRSAVGRYLNEKNYHIHLDEFPIIRDILFRSYNEFILHDINRQQYLSRMLSRRDNQTAEHFIVWFQFFLCKPNSDWVDYQILLDQWTECFFDKQDLFSNIIKQTDMLIEIWTNAAPNNTERVTFFIKHMVAQCLRQSKKMNRFYIFIFNRLFI